MAGAVLSRGDGHGGGGSSGSKKFIMPAPALLFRVPVAPET